MVGKMFKILCLVCLLCTFLRPVSCVKSKRKIIDESDSDFEEPEVESRALKSIPISSGNHENSVVKTKLDKLSSVFKNSIIKLKQKHKKIDLVFLIDSSSSVGKVNFQNEVRFVKKLLADFTVSFNHTRVAIVTFSSQGKVIRHIDQISEARRENDKCMLINHDIPKIRFVGGGTFTYGAFNEAKIIFKKARKHSKKVVFLITDGFSNGKDPVPLAMELKSENVTIYSVGIENGNYAELYNISSAPQEKHHFLLDSFPQFESLARKALHFDFRVGSYISTNNESFCDSLCELGENSTSCCDEHAECNCGTSSGHFTCICEPGYYGSGLRDSCQICPNGTYWHSWNLCKPCPDINHITTSHLTTSIDDCICKSGFKAVGNHKCEVIRCPALNPPENGYFVKHPTGCGNVLNAACGARCKSGYQLTGSSIRLCQQNGTWSGSDPVCSLKACPALPIPFYGLAICKNHDLNLFYDYSPRNETFMVHFENEERRITEPMPIDTDCNFKCGPGYYLVGSGSRNCLPLAKWDGLHTACKQILCSPLPRIPFGQYDPTDCDESKSSHGTNCTIQCLEGFELRGPSFKMCNGKRNGIWSNKNKNPKCVDVTAPNITCPEDYKLELDPHSSHVTIKELKLPLITDNSNLNISFWSKPALKENGTILTRGEHIFSYVSVDAFKNRAKCNFTITVKDITPPVIDNCIDPEVIKIRSNDSIVEWDEPAIYDNSNEPINVTQNLKPGILNPGSYVVNYTAVDSSNNSNTCLMNLTIEEVRCHKLDAPRHGQIICASNITNMWCEVSCDTGFGIYDEAEDQQLESLHLICNHDDPKWKWDHLPDCSEIQLPDSINEVLSIDLETELEFCSESVNKAELMESIQKELCGDQVNCSVVSEMPSCSTEDEEKKPELENVIYHLVKREVVPPSQKPKRLRQRKKINVKINIYTRISKKLGVWDGNLTRSDNVKKIRHELEHLHENPRLKSRISDLKIDLSKLKIDINMTCPRGNVLKRHVCVMCPRGTFHNVLGNKCQLCPTGSYSSSPGQMECKSCPDHHATRRSGSKSGVDCVQKCPPGTIARLKSPKNPLQTRVIKSLMPYCKRCLPGQYQPKYDQTACHTCPEGFISPRGSKFESDCVPKIVNPCDSGEKVCGNHGTCIPDLKNPFLYSCNCAEGFFGSHCEIILDPCLSSPCENGGSCLRMGHLEVMCKCSEQFSGKFCENLSNPCSQDLCKNNGTCVESEGKLLCECQIGFEGDRCEKVLDHCVNKPCDSGVCINTPYGYLCQCPPGLLGRRCHLHPCDFRPCDDNRVCENLLHSPATQNSFICRCPKGFTGLDCKTIDNPCDKNPCKNNGICKPNTLQRGPHIDEDLYDQYICECPIYFYGNLCETLINPDFVLKFTDSQTTDYVKLKGPERGLTEISLCAWIQSNDTKNYGTIISYATQTSDNMFTVTDYNGLTFYVNGSHVTSDIVINDGKWHFICVSWENRQGSFEMYMDGQLHLSGSNLSVGGVIEPGGIMILGQDQDDIGTGFSASETFVGKIGYLDIWDRVVTIKEIQDFYTTCEPYHGNLYVWSDFKTNLIGKVQVVYSPFCKECPKNISVAHGRINFINNNAIYSCHDGYKMDSLPIRYCLRTSQWKDPAPICRAITCPTISKVPQGRAFVTRYTFGGRVSYSCNEGHTLQGQSIRSCQMDGRWSGVTPECISIIKCPSLPTRDGIRIIYSTDKGPLSYEVKAYPVGTLAEIECLHQTLLQGEYMLSCQENGEWDFPIPHCGDSEEVTTEIRKFSFHPELEFLSSSPSFRSIPLNQSITQTIPIELNREEFWSEFRNYLYHGCTSQIYKSKFCSLDQSSFADLSNMNIQDMEGKTEKEWKVYNILKETLEKGSDNLTVANFYERIITKNQNLLNESHSRLILCFSMDFVIWNLESYTSNIISQSEIDAIPEPRERIIYLLVRIMVPVFNNFNKIYKYSDFFEMVKPTEAISTDKTCEMKDIPSLSNGFYNMKDDKVVYGCNPDYLMIGNHSVFCNRQKGNWRVESNGRCERICENVQLPSNIKAIDKKASVSGETILLECIEGYQIHGKPTIQCLPSGKWTKSMCRCSKISCNKPKLSSGTVLSGRSYLYQDKIKVQCNEGVFELQCQSNGKWSPEISC